MRRIPPYAARLPRVLITGMSGAGKSTLLAALADRRHRTVDTDYGDWKTADGRWDPARMNALLGEHADLIISGTVENQSDFYERIDLVVLLSCPVDVLMERLRTRTTNEYGKSAAEQAEVIRYVEEVEPLLRRGADVELDGRRPIAHLADAVEYLRGRHGLGA